MLCRYLRYSYRIRKPRVLSENDISLIRYRKQLRQARRNILTEAIEHEHQYENLFLERHKQQMLDKHNKNQMNYRSQIIMNGFRLMKGIEQWKVRDESKKLRLEGHIHKENLKKMNKDRMLKILNYESENYWYNPQNIQKRLVEETIVPEFVGSTQHYQHLTEQALAYEMLDFDQLQRIENDEMAMRFKNKLLIPIYNDVVKTIKKVKGNEFKDNEDNYRNKVDRINSLYTMPEIKKEKETELSKAKLEYENKRTELLKKMQSHQNREAFIKDKIVQIRNLLYHWKKYATVLNLNTVEVDLIRKKSEVDQKLSKIARKIQQNQINLKKQTEREGVYAHVQEANTEEEEEIDMKTFLQADPDELSPNDRIQVNYQDLQKLDKMLQTPEQPVLTELKQDPQKHMKVNLGEKESLDLYNQLNTSEDKDINIPQEQRFKENSSVLIQSWKKLTKDPELKKLLDEVGETHVQQSVLFWKVFSMH